MKPDEIVEINLDMKSKVILKQLPQELICIIQMNINIGRKEKPLW
jgi:hypothetical protein